MKKQKISEAITDYMRRREIDGKSENTRYNEERSLRRFCSVVGDRLVSSIDDEHLDLFFEDVRRTRPRSQHIDYTAMRNFLAWAQNANPNRYPRGRDPMWGRKAPKVDELDLPRLHRSRFPDLLSAAGESHPRDRAACSLGIYLFLRQSEALHLRYKDIFWDEGRIGVWVLKARPRWYHRMAMSEELEHELRTWVTFYTRHVGDMRPHYYLLPRLNTTGSKRDPVTGHFLPGQASRDLTILPEAQLGGLEDVVQGALQAINFDTRAEDGSTLRTGEHTLRRSGARAMYEELRAKGVPDAVQAVRAMLHHKRVEQTEHYIGVETHREYADDLVRGQRMYSLSSENVTPIRAAK